MRIRAAAEWGGRDLPCSQRSTVRTGTRIRCAKTARETSSRSRIPRMASGVSSGRGRGSRCTVRSVRLPTRCSPTSRRPSRTSAAMLPVNHCRLPPQPCTTPRARQPGGHPGTLAAQRSCRRRDDLVTLRECRCLDEDHDSQNTLCAYLREVNNAVEQPGNSELNENRTGQGWRCSAGMGAVSGPEGLDIPGAENQLPPKGLTLDGAWIEDLTW